MMRTLQILLILSQFSFMRVSSENDVEKVLARIEALKQKDSILNSSLAVEENGKTFWISSNAMKNNLGAKQCEFNLKELYKTKNLSHILDIDQTQVMNVDTGNVEVISSIYFKCEEGETCSGITCATAETKKKETPLITKILASLAAVVAVIVFFVWLIYRCKNNADGSANTWIRIGQRGQRNHAQKQREILKDKSLASGQPIGKETRF